MEGPGGRAGCEPGGAGRGLPPWIAGWILRMPGVNGAFTAVEKPFSLGIMN